MPAEQISDDDDRKVVALLERSAIVTAVPQPGFFLDLEAAVSIQSSPVQGKVNVLLLCSTRHEEELPKREIA